MNDPTRIPRIMMAIQSLWAANPNLTFGQLIEKVEDASWRELETVMMREYSARWAHLPDAFLEAGLAKCKERPNL